MDNRINEMGARIRSLRQDMKMNQEEMDQQLHISKRSYMKVENGARFCGADEIVRLSKICGVTTDYILFGENSTSIVERLLSQISFPEQRYLRDAFVNILRAYLSKRC